MTNESITLNKDGSVPVTDPMYREHLIFTAARIKTFKGVDERLKKIALTVAKRLLHEEKPKRILAALLDDLHTMHSKIDEAIDADKAEQVEMIDTMFPILEPEEYGMSIECIPTDNSPGVFDLRILSISQVEEEKKRADS